MRPTCYLDQDQNADICRRKCDRHTVGNADILSEMNFSTFVPSSYLVTSR